MAALPCKTWGPAGALAIRAAMAFLLVSSLGAFALAGLMASHAQSQAYYFSALYFFLHFQYNGWFFFGIAGLLASRLPDTGQYHLYRGIKCLVFACIPAVMLSGLWMKVPGWVFLLSGMVVLVQIRAIVLVARGLIPAWRKLAVSLHTTEKWLLKLSFLAALLRFLLQSLSSIPALSRFAFAYRPVVIGYLHLVLLGCITLFLLSWLYAKGLWQKNPNTCAVGMALFIAGIMGTEGTLMLQGFGYIGWVSIPYTNETLFASALLMAAGILVLFASARTATAGKA